MTTQNIRKLLYFLTKEKSDISIGKVLAVFYNQINLTDKKSLFESLQYYYNIFSDNDINVDSILAKFDSDDKIETYKNSDYRIKNLEVANLRGIPDEDTNHIKFGIDFTDNGIISNAIILANNGTGKSSIFSGLEMIYCQEIGEKKLRTEDFSKIKQEEYKNYLKRYPKNLIPYCKIETENGFFDLDNIVFKDESVKKIFNPSNHFISEFDIYHYGQKRYNGLGNDNNSFHFLIAESLGLSEIINLQSLLNGVASYRRTTEITALNKLKEEKNTGVRYLQEINAQISQVESQVENLNEIINNNKEVKNTGEERNKDFIDKSLQKQLIYELDILKLMNKLDQFKDLFTQKLMHEVDENKTLEREFFENGLKLLHNSENCPFCDNSNSSHNEIQARIEKLIIDLKQIQSIEVELKEKFIELTYLLSYHFDKSKAILEEVNIERVSFSTIKELDGLSDQTEKIYVALNLALSDDVLIETISELGRKNTPTQTDYKKLFNVLTSVDLMNNQTYIMNLITNYISERKKILQHTKEIFNKSEEVINLADQVRNHKQDIEKLDNSKKIAEEELEKINKRIIISEKTVELVTKIKNEVSLFLPFFNLEINKIINESFTPIQSTVETVLNEYLKDENIVFTIQKIDDEVEIDGESYTQSTITAVLNIQNSSGDFVNSITPDIYFNTFRYKLFCLMVSLSLALSTRKKYNVNFPLVMDDLFFASDFASKNSFAQFFNKVINLFYRHTPDLPLQVILFTHDDLIFRSALDAIEVFKLDENIPGNLCADNKKLLFEKTLIGRLFNPSDKDDSPSKFESGLQYWNLLYKLPKDISQLINN